MSSSRDWILGLAPAGDPGEIPEPVCPAATVAVAATVLGPGPVAWAVQTALAITEEVIEKVPEHGGGPAPFATLRASVESTVLLCLRGLHADMPPEGDVTPEAASGGAEAARRGIPLDRVLRGARIGHARLHHELIAAIENLPEPERREESRRVGDLLFGYADLHASRLAEEYLRERARWEAGRAADRRRVVEDLLAGKEVSPESASETLGYELARHHQAFVVTATAPGSGQHVGAADLQRCAEDLGRTMAPDGWLSLPAATGQIWAWAGWRASPSDGHTGQVRRLRTPGIRVAAGPVAYGPAGLRRSHLGAREADRVAAATGTDGWCDYAEVRTLSLATADSEQARWYAEDVLGPLLSDDDRARDLRETLRVYLACERSPQAAAEKLHVARNTVTYRVHKAEELLGGPLGDLAELRLALEIARTLEPGARRES